jgi:hypothetical protein
VRRTSAIEGDDARFPAALPPGFSPAALIVYGRCGDCGQGH